MNPRLRRIMLADLLALAGFPEASLVDGADEVPTKQVGKPARLPLSVLQ
jgi:hypothetical protein